jgi:hypothetical protein
LTSTDGLLALCLNPLIKGSGSEVPEASYLDTWNLSQACLPLQRLHTHSTQQRCCNIFVLQQRFKLGRNGTRRLRASTQSRSFLYKKFVDELQNLQPKTQRPTSRNMADWQGN